MCVTKLGNRESVGNLWCSNLLELLTNLPVYEKIFLVAGAKATFDWIQDEIMPDYKCIS